MPRKGKYGYVKKVKSKFDRFDLPKYWPYYVHKEFKDAMRLVQIAHDFTKLHTEIKKLAGRSSTQFIDFQKIDEAVKTIITEIAANAPYRICTNKDFGDESQCPICEGRGWMTAKGNRAEIERRAAMFPIVAQSFYPGR